MSLIFCQDRLSQMKTKVENDMYIDLFRHPELHNFNKIPSRGLKRSVKKYYELPNTDWVAENHWCVPLYYKGDCA